MTILAFILLLIGLAKLFIAMSFDNANEINQLLEGINNDNNFKAIIALLIADGLVCLLCSLYLLCIIV